MSYVVVNLHATASATARTMDQDNDLAVRGLDELLRFEAKLFKGYLHLMHRIAKRVPPTEDAGRVDHGGVLVKLEVGGEEILGHVTSPVERLVTVAKSVYVLLRHRVRQYPPSKVLAAEETESFPTSNDEDP